MDLPGFHGPDNFQRGSQYFALCLFNKFDDLDYALADWNEQAGNKGSN